MGRSWGVLDSLSGSFGKLGDEILGSAKLAVSCASDERVWGGSFEVAMTGAGFWHLSRELGTFSFSVAGEDRRPSPKLFNMHFMSIVMSRSPLQVK